MSGPDDAIREVETLIAALESDEDSKARQLARNLLHLVLDLHGLALARMAAMLAAEPGGGARIARLAEDPHVRAVLLLHGLHPEEAALRVARAVALLNQEFASEHVEVRVVSVSAAAARLRVRRGRADPVMLAERIEAVVVEAAPDLEELTLEGLHRGSENAFSAMAG
jgi:hypothetical protein